MESFNVELLKHIFRKFAEVLEPIETYKNNEKFLKGNRYLYKLLFKEILYQDDQFFNLMASNDLLVIDEEYCFRKDVTQYEINEVHRLIRELVVDCFNELEIRLKNCEFDQELFQKNLNNLEGFLFIHKPKVLGSEVMEFYEKKIESLKKLDFPENKRLENEKQFMEQVQSKKHDEKVKNALEILDLFSKKNVRKEEIMDHKDFQRLKKYTLKLICDNEIDENIKPIEEIKLPNNYIMYTFYRIHKLFYPKRTRNEKYLIFLYKVFDQLKEDGFCLDMPESTLYKKFTIQPLHYTSDILLFE